MTGTAGGDGFGCQPGAGVADAGHSGVGNEGDGLPGLYVLDQFGGTGLLVVLVAAYGGGCDLEMVEELLGLAGIFAGDAVHLLEDLEGAEGDVAQVADGSGYQVKAGG